MQYRDDAASRGEAPAALADDLADSIGSYFGDRTNADQRTTRQTEESSQTAQVRGEQHFEMEDRAMAKQSAYFGETALQRSNLLAGLEAESRAQRRHIENAAVL